MVREGRVLISVATDPDFGSSYYVTAYEVGAQVTSGSASTTVTVRAGHGFAANDKFIVFSGTTVDLTKYRTVSAVTSTTLTTTAVSVAAGDLLVNLAADTGVAAPNYDGAGLTIYTDMDYSNVATNNTVTTDSNGKYRYFHKGVARWELVRSSLTAPIALYADTGNISGEDQTAYEVRYAHLFATSGAGTLADPWPGAAILSARNDLPVGANGKVKMVPGVFDLGSGAIGLNLDYNGVYTTGFVLEGSGGGNEETGTVGPANANDGGTMLLYSGTGEAIRIGSFSTANSNWLENATLKDFKVRQTGTAGTGIGILARLFRYSKVENVNCTDFSVGFALASVSDFNYFDRLRIRDCQLYGVEIGRTTAAGGAALGGTVGQCNGNRFSDCDIMNSARDSGYVNWGIYVHVNSVSQTFRDSEFHNFDTGGATYGAIRVDDATTNSNNCLVDSCYFEGNYISVYHNNPFGAGTETQCGITVTNCWITQIEGYGVYCNSGGAGGETRGVVVRGNTFNVPTNASPYNAAVGIRLGTYCTKADIGGNSYVVQSPLGYTLPGGNVTHASLGTITEDHIILGAVKITSTDTSGTLAVKGATTLSSTLNVTGATVLSSTLWATGTFSENATGLYNGTTGATWQRGYAEEDLVLSTSGTTTNTAASLLPGGALILGVVARVTTTIATATDWKLGDTTTAGRFCPAQSGAQLTSGATIVGLDHWSGAVTTLAAGPSQAAATTVRVTTTGTPSAGRIRIGVYYMLFTAPTS